MDLDLKDPTLDDDGDDDIIELTDIIEKGDGNKASPEAIEEGIDNLVGDLGNTSSAAPNIPSDAEADIDALLAQMDSGVDFTQIASEPAPTSSSETNADAATGDPSDAGDIDALLAQMDAGVDFTEIASNPAPKPSSDTSLDANSDSPTDDLPDTSDVDALLASLDMPPQPENGAKSAPLSSDDDSAADMDALLESIMDETPAKSTAPKAEPSPAKAEPSSDAADLSDLDAMLSDLDAPKAEPSPAKAEPSSTEESDDILNDLDELMRSVDEESNTSVEQTEEQSTADADVNLDDLDAVLNDMDLNENIVSVEDIAENLLSDAQDQKATKSSETLSDTIMEAVNVVTGNIDLEAEVGQDTGAQNATEIDDKEISSVLDEVMTAPAEENEVIEDISAIIEELPEEVSVELESAKVVDDIETAVDSSSLGDIGEEVDLSTLADDIENVQLVEQEAILEPVSDSELATPPVAEQGLEMENPSDMLDLKEDESQEIKVDEQVNAAEGAENFEAEATKIDEDIVQEETPTANDDVVPVASEAVIAEKSNLELEKVDAATPAIDMEQLHKLEAANKELVDRVAYLERRTVSLENQYKIQTDQYHMIERIAYLEGRIASLEDQLVNDIEKLAAKAAAKVIREEIAAMISDG